MKQVHRFYKVINHSRGKQVRRGKAGNKEEETREEAFHVVKHKTIQIKGRSFSFATFKQHLKLDKI